jgi:hypothetical protein
MYRIDCFLFVTKLHFFRVALYVIFLGLQQTRARNTPIRKPKVFSFLIFIANKKYISEVLHRQISSFIPRWGIRG